MYNDIRKAAKEYKTERHIGPEVTDDIAAFAYLNDLADEQDLASLEMNNIEFSDLKSYGAAINNIQIFSYLGVSFIPFACPDTMVSIVADFILSLIEVDYTELKPVTSPFEALKGDAPLIHEDGNNKEDNNNTIEE